MQPVFVEIIGSDNRKYRVNVNHILYFYAFEKKGTMLTEIVFNNKESVETDETPSQIDARITKLYASQNNGQRELAHV